MKCREDGKAGDGAIDRTLLQRRHHVAQRHRHRGCTKLLERGGLEIRSENPDFLALKVAEPRKLRLHN